MAKMTV